MSASSSSESKVAAAGAANGLCEALKDLDHHCRSALANAEDGARSADIALKLATAAARGSAAALLAGTAAKEAAEAHPDVALSVMKKARCAAKTSLTLANSTDSVYKNILLGSAATLQDLELAKEASGTAVIRALVSENASAAAARSI